MKTARFIFVGDLNDLLSGDKKQTTIECSFNDGQSVKHLIESLGVPHTEVNHILVDGKPVDFSYLVRDGDRVSVYPVSLQPDEVEDGLQSKLTGEPRFVLDNHLGQLAAYLRMLGFDALYRNDYQDDELAIISNRQERVLLTRDRHLLMRNMVVFGYWVRSKIPREQLVEIVQRYHLAGLVRPFERCMRCNGILQPVQKEQIMDRLEPLTKLYFDDFRICPDCGQIYWKGSHYERMLRLIEQAGL
jgi:uncharacterized protein with PIN domain